MLSFGLESTGIVEGMDSDSVRLQDGTVVPAGVVRLADGTEIPAGTVVWAAGVRAEDVVDSLGIDLGSQRRVPVSATLQLSGHPEVLAAGDIAEITQDGKPLPMLGP